MTSAKERRRVGHLLFTVFAFQSNLYVHWRLASWEVAEHRLRMGSREQTFFFSLLVLMQIFVFTLVNCLISTNKLFSIYFLFPAQLGKGLVVQFGGHLESGQGQPTAIPFFALKVFLQSAENIPSVQSFVATSRRPNICGAVIALGFILISRCGCPQSMKADHQLVFTFLFSSKRTLTNSNSLHPNVCFNMHS